MKEKNNERKEQKEIGLKEFLEMAFFYRRNSFPLQNIQTKGE